MSDYPATPLNRVKRGHDRAVYDRTQVHAILDAAMLCHIAYVIDDQPFCTPTIHWREGEMLYWHGSSASRAIRAQGKGLRVCLTVTHLDGIVLARSAFNHSCNFRSAMIFGTAELVSDPAEKTAALIAITDRLVPGRNAELRQMSAQEIKATSVMRMKIDAASAKVRAENVGDDAEDGAHPVWAGVIPVRMVIDPPVASPALIPGIALPAHLDPFAPGRKLDEALLETQAIYEAPLR